MKPRNTEKPHARAPMTPGELWTTWVVSAFPLIFVILMVTTELKTLTGPLTSLTFFAVYYLKTWLLSDNGEAKKRVESWGKPITRRQATLMALVLPALILFLVLLGWLEGAIGRKPIIGALIASIAALWVKECVDAWKQYRAARP